MARRLLANQWRARRAAPAILPLAVDAARHERPAGEGAAGRLAAVQAALAKLSGADQEILRLVGWEELTVAEAAIVLGCRRATAAVRLHRARRRLAETLRPVSTGNSTMAPVRP